jgi:hypothetical protein
MKGRGIDGKTIKDTHKNQNREAIQKEEKATLFQQNLQHSISVF